MLINNERTGHWYPLGVTSDGGTIGRWHWVNSQASSLSCVLGYSFAWGFIHWDNRDYNQHVAPSPKG